MVNPLNEYYERVKGLIRDRCGDGAVLILSPPLTWADKLANELVKELGKDKVRHYIIGSEGGREEAKSLTDIIKKIKNPVKESKPLVGILKRIRDSIRKSESLVVDGKLMNELRDLLGDDLVGGVKPDCIIPYYISWDDARDYANKMDVDKEIKNALDLITKGFEGKGRRITWFGLDYVPEELVEEAMSAKSEDVERWIDAYLHIISKLNLDGGVSYEVKNVFKRFIEPIKASLPAIGQVMHVVPELSTRIVAVALSLIDSPTKDEKFAFKDIIDTVTHLKALRRGGDLNTLGKLIAYKLAVDMGVSYEVAYNVLAGFAGLADDVLGVIEERLDINLIKSQSVEGAFRVYDKGGFESNAEAHPGISIRGNELLIRGSVIGGSALETYRVVTTKGFNDLRDEVLRRLDDEGVVVLVGPRGIGKTTLATYTTWTLFKEGKLKFMTNVKSLPEEKGTEFTDFIGYYLDNKYDDKYGNLLVVYDPSTTKTYSLADKRTEVPKGISNTIDTLLKSIAEDEKVRGRVRLLMVLPTDIYQALSQDLKDRLGKYVLDLEEKGFLKDPEFLTAVIIEYAKGCSIDYDRAKALAGKILSRFNEGYTLIARLAGTLIASEDYKCRVDDVERIIEESRGDAHYFILRYINALFKVHKDPSIAETLVEVFALRKPLINEVGPGAPILTPGIVGLIGKEKKAKTLYGAEGRELRSWLTHKQHDLIEDSIEKLLKCIANEVEECKKLDTALEPWRLRTVRESLRKVSEEVKDVRSAIDYFTNNYGEKLIDALREDYSNCWRRAALIIGYASAGHDLVPRPEDLPSDVVESLSDALNECKIASNLSIDDYLLVDNKIPPLIMNLVLNNTRILTEALYDNIIIKTKIKIKIITYAALAGAFIDKYNEAVADVNRILKIARKRGINVAEMFYGLGLASIIAKAAGSVKPGDADAALHIASFTIQRVASTDLIKSVLGALEPLRDKAPLGYLKLLVPASSIENLDSGTVRYIFDKLNYVLNIYGDVVKGHAWSLVYAIDAYANLLRTFLVYFSYGEIENMVGRVVDLLNELGRFKTSLGAIAWAFALAPALDSEYVRMLMMKTLRINKVDEVIDKASEILEELGKMRGKVKGLMRDEVFMGYIESTSVKADEEAVRRSILETASFLKYALARYRLYNDELDKAKDLFKDAAEENREIGDYENYLIARGLALRAEAIKGSLVGDELVKKFQQLYEEAFNKERFSMPTAWYLSIASHVLGNYLVSLALTGDHETISKLLEKHLWVLNANERFSVLTRLTLNALLRPRGGLSSELEGRLSVNPGELIDTFGSDMHIEFLPALRVALGITKPDMYAISVAMNDNAAVVQLRGWLIDTFRGLLSKKLGLLKELGANADVLFNEFRGLVNGLDGKSLAQLIAPDYSMARLALMLHALINGDKELAKAHALYGAVYATGSKLLTRLFLEAYKECKEYCDLGKDEFRRAVARLFFYHV